MKKRLLYVVDGFNGKLEVQSVEAVITNKTATLRERIGGFGFRTRLPVSGKLLKQHTTPEAAIKTYIESEQREVASAIENAAEARRNIKTARLMLKNL